MYKNKPELAKEYESKTKKSEDLPMYAKKKTNNNKKQIPIANKDTMNKYSGEVKIKKKK